MIILHVKVYNLILKTLNKKNQKVDKLFDLNIHERSGRSLGWCRGFQKVKSVNIVGFSRIRPTKFVENIKWLGSKVSDKLKLKMHTRIVFYNNNFSKILDSIDVKKSKMNWENH